MKHSEGRNYTIYNMSCLDLLDDLPEGSVDAIVTDPPYEIGFMNKGWDSTGIAFSVDTWRKALRVLKEGGYLLSFNHSRTFHRMVVAIEDAGFEIRDTIMWLYGSGFPKSHNISKAIDKRGDNNLTIEEVSNAIKNARLKKNLTVKYCDEKYCNGSTNWSWYEGRKDGARYPDYETFKKICVEFPELTKYKEKIKQAEREVVGKYETDMGGLGGERLGSKGGDITAPATDKAKEWQGWGTALKPAFEPIVMARKPLDGTVADNVLKHGVGGINIDGCRVDFGDEKVPRGSGNPSKGYTWSMNGNGGNETNPQGRFPANVIHDGSDEVVALFPNDGEDSNARFFYTAKASKKDREEGLDGFEKQFTASAEFRPNHMEKALEGDNGNPYGRWQPKKNIHPTVKPTDLMQYLVRLVAPKGSTVMDMFLGSGSTGKAVMIENTERNSDYKFIGVDLSKEYCDIAQARIEFGIHYKDIEIAKSEEVNLGNGIGKQVSIFDLEE